MRALDKKLYRDLWQMRGQALAIAMVIASGVATLVMSLSTLHSMRSTRAAYYDDYRFADVFASLKRAPESVRARLREIPGIQTVQTRVVAAVNLDVPDYPEPVAGQLISLPDEGLPLLNGVYLRDGRFPAPYAADEVVVSDTFAEAHNFPIGGKIGTTINGRRQNLTVVGVGLSPEHIYQMKPGSIFPDFEGYAIMWMRRTPLASAYDMDGAFNDVTATLARDGIEADVLDRMDRILEPYGGVGAYGRDEQLSHRYISEEFRQLTQMATLFPTIFLGVAAFLLNVVVNRLVNTQREQAAALKAFGYSNVAIGFHYLKLVTGIVLIGIVLGVGVGAWLGSGLSQMYRDYYKFPYLNYVLRPNVILIGALVSLGAGAAGTIQAVRRAALMPPAQAMRPEPPAAYRESVVERIGFKRLLAQPSRMIVRHLERTPGKSALSILGIALACSVLMVGRLFGDAVGYMIYVTFGLSQRDDMTVTFVEPTSTRVMHDLENMPGIDYGEPFRSVPVRLRFEHRTYRSSIQGVTPGADLYRLLNEDLQPITVPPDGILLTDQLGTMLGIHPGDLLTVEVLEGRRPVVQIPVAALVKQFVGVSAYMNLEALNRLLGEGHAVSGAYLAAQEPYEGEIYQRLEDMPRVAATEIRQRAVDTFYEMMNETMLTFAFFNTLLAATIAFGVVYNSARIALSERSRELASLRVLGFTRGEISYILLGELAVLTLAAIPVGFVLGRWLSAYMIAGMQSDLYRIPLIIMPRTYAFAATVIVVSAAVSGAIVGRHLRHLDLVAVLKTKE